MLPRGEASYQAASTDRYPFDDESESESNPIESEFDTVGTLHRSLKDASISSPQHWIFLTRTT